MFGEDYAYAVARIRVLETGLLNQAAIEQLLACQDEQQCLQLLTEKGWGNGDPAAGADAILSREKGEDMGDHGFSGSGQICIFRSFLSGSFP